MAEAGPEKRIRLSRATAALLDKSIEPIVKIERVKHSGVTRERYRLLAHAALSSLYIHDPLRQAYIMAEIVILARKFGADVSDEDYEYARRTIYVLSGLLVSARYVGGFGERETPMEGKVGRVYYMSGRMFEELSLLGFSDEEKEDLILKLRDLGAEILMDDRSEEILGIRMDDAAFSYLLQNVVVKTLPRLMDIVSTLISRAAEIITINLPFFEAARLQAHNMLASSREGGGV